MQAVSAVRQLGSNPTVDQTQTVTLRKTLQQELEKLEAKKVETQL